MKKRFYSFLITVCVLTFSACKLFQADRNINQAPISRYDQITAEKVLPIGDSYPPILHSDRWVAPRPVQGKINSAGLEDSPFITPDGETIFFFYTPSSDSPAEAQIHDHVTGIYLSKKENGVWQEPERVSLTKENQPALDGCPFFLNNVLWFCSIREGNFRDIDIWTADWDGKKWGNIKNAGQFLNQEIQIEEMHLSKDRGTLIFHKPDIDQRNGYDLWKIQWIGDDWSQPFSLGALNSQEDDSRPALSPNEDELWFTRTYNGTPAIFRSRLVQDEWEEPEMIISQFAGEPSIDMFGNIYFTHHFFQEDKMIEADIYIAEKK